MAYIRSPIATNVRYVRQWRSSPRCLVVTLSASFIAFNWLIYHAVHGRHSTIDADTPNSSSHPSTEHSYNWTWSSSTTHRSYQNAPDWFANWIRWRGLDPGVVDRTLDTPKFDIVYTWVNGSDPALQSMRHEYQNKSPLFSQPGAGDQKTIEAVTTKRFRDMDELRYSIRSVAEYATEMYRHVHLLTTEVKGQGQVPGWLESDRNIVRLVHHGTVFENSTHLPSFNSLAIESQIYRIPGVTDVFLYMNDDVFLGTKMLPSDIWTALYGFVFHMEGSLLVPPTIRPTESNPLNIGEWSSLQYSNYLLSERFGPRYRAYLAHVPHVLSVSMLKEIQEQWPQQFESTSSHRFRGEGDARDIQVSFFMAHYVVEMLRETQLESYWLHRLDSNQDGILDWEEREGLIRLVQSWNSNHHQEARLRQGHSRPTMIAGYDHILQSVGVPMSGSTVYRHAGLDGYPYLLQNADTSRTIPLSSFTNVEGKEQQPQTPYMNYEHPQSRTCHMDLPFCLGDDFLSPALSAMSSVESQRVFHRTAFEEFHCGDCLLQILAQHPDAGVRAWMPSDEHSEVFRKVTQKVARYNYVLGTSDYSFIALQSAEGSQQNLDGLLNARGSKAFFCINDDFPDNEELQSNIRGIFSRFLNVRFSRPSPWERE